MAILTSQGTEITLVTQVAGQLCYNVLAYDSNDPEVYYTPTAIGNAWLTEFQTAWKNVQSVEANWIALKVSTSHPTGVPAYSPVVIPLTGVGTISGECLPPFVAARLDKVLDPSTFEPTTPVKPFRPGAIRIAGIGESSQANGFLTSAYLSVLTTLAESLSMFTVSADTYYMHQVHLTNPPGESYEAVRVLDLVANSLVSTQNSRKVSF